MGETSKNQDLEEVEVKPSGGPLYNRLAEHKASLDTLKAEFPNVSILTSRILGDYPVNTAPVFGLTKSNYAVYNYFVPRFANIPFTDINSLPLLRFTTSSLSPLYRSAVMYASSKTYTCAYCSNHCNSIGDVFSGARERTEDTKSPDNINPKLTDPAVNLAIAACMVPSQVTVDQVKEVTKRYGKTGLAEIAGFCCLMGWLNFFMQIMAAPTEKFFQQGQKYVKTNGFFSVPNFVQIVKVLTAASKVSNQEKSWFENAPPKKPKALEAWVKTHFGLIPLWYSTFHQNGRDAATVMLQECVLESTESWTSISRAKIWLLYSFYCKNTILVKHVLLLLHKSFSSKLAFDTEIDFLGDFGNTEKLGSVLKIIKFVSSVPHPPLPEDLTDELFHICEGKAPEVISFLTTLGFGCTMHRLSNILSLTEQTFSEGLLVDGLLEEIYGAGFEAKVSQYLDAL